MRLGYEFQLGVPHFEGAGLLVQIQMPVINSSDAGLDPACDGSGAMSLSTLLDFKAERATDRIDCAQRYSKTTASDPAVERVASSSSALRGRAEPGHHRPCGYAEYVAVPHVAERPASASRRAAAFLRPCVTQRSGSPASSIRPAM